MDTFEESFDHIVVGAGAAGCVVAARLSEDPQVKVLLIEAGGPDRGLFLRMPLALPFVYQDTTRKWGHVSGPEPQLGGRTLQEQGGKVVGGSSSINAMIFNRGNPLDYERWSTEAGLTTWDHAHVLPYFKKLETFEDGPDDFRGGDGPMRISRAPAKHQLYDDFLEAGVQAGYEIAEDHNGARQEGMHRAQVNIHGGERWSAARAYLRPALARENLTLLTRTTVSRLLLSDGEVVGVEAEHRGEPTRLTARREVILCAGAMNTPKLLMVSGIGPEEELARHGIAMAAEAPDVGRNLQNHPGVDIQFATATEHSLTSRITVPRQALLGARWMLTRTGLGASNLFEGGAFLRTREDVDFPNMQFEFLPLCRTVVRGKVLPVPGFQVWMDLSRPQSRGRITLTSADPAAPVSTVFDTYSARQDLVDVLDGVRLLRERIVARKPLQQYRPTELAPGPDVRDPAELEAWVRHRTGTSYHASSSCRMGADDRSVVDPEGRVRAVHRLRIVDASIMPLSVTANLQAAVLMMAEKIADALRGREPLTPTPVPFHSSPGRSPSHD